MERNYSNQKLLLFSAEENSPSFEVSKAKDQEEEALKDLNHLYDSKQTQPFSLRSSQTSSFEKESSEVVYLRKKIQSIEAEKLLHIENHAKEKSKLQSQVNELRSEVREITRNSGREICSLKEQCRNLEKELETLREVSLQKIHYYKKKFQAFEENYQSTVHTKDSVIAKLKAKLLRKRKEDSPVVCRKKNHTPRRHTHRAKTPNNDRLDDLSSLIVNLEATHAEYKQLQISLLNADNPSQIEIERISQLLKTNENRLSEARALQEQAIRTQIVK